MTEEQKNRLSLDELAALTNRHGPSARSEYSRLMEQTNLMSPKQRIISNSLTAGVIASMFLFATSTISIKQEPDYSQEPVVEEQRPTYNKRFIAGFAGMGLFGVLSIGNLYRLANNSVREREEITAQYRKMLE